MPVLKAGVADPTKFFNLNGLDYPKNGWTLYYSNLIGDSNGDLDENVLQVGLSYLEEPSLTLQYPALVVDWRNGSDVAYTTLDSLLSDMGTLINLGSSSGSKLRYIPLYAAGKTGDLAVDTKLDLTECPYTGTITNIYGYVDTAPVGSSVIFDVNIDGTTTMAVNKVEIESTENSSRTATTAPTITNGSVTAGDVLSLDVDQIGITTAGSGFPHVVIEIELT